MNHKNIKKEVAIGILVGFLATAIGFFFYTQFFFNYKFDVMVKLIKEQHLLGNILGYSVLPNLLAFFVFIKKKQDYRARGVLIATFLVAITILISKFL